MDFLKNKIFKFKNRTDLIIKNYCLDNSYKYVWGMKKSGEKTRRNKIYIKTKKIIFLEDGFINSFGEKQKIPLSICYDKGGIFYDFHSNSDINYDINTKLEESENLRAQKLIYLWKKHNLSKYNYPNIIDPPKDPYILLIDQTRGDLSIKYGGADTKTFKNMLDFAISKWPNYKIVIKIHPDVINSSKKGCFEKTVYSKKNIIIISEKGQINQLIKCSKAVCVVTSQVGFEALIYGKEVHVFGIPFYSGLGLTTDHNSYNFKKFDDIISLEQLVFGVLIKYHKYLDPRNNKLCDIEKIIEYLARKRKLSNLIPEDCHALNLTPWKTRQLNKYILEAGRDKVRFWTSFKSKFKNVIVWGRPKKLEKYSFQADNLISVEDGFIRSVGLGGDLYPPLSLIFDKKNIYYDSSKISDLENLLQNRILSEKELLRSKKLIELLKKYKISKYNLKTTKKINFKELNGREIILVLGQVETDNSIIYGVLDNTISRSNYELVKKVKNDNPNSYIIYKPHPDVEAGLRLKGSKERLIKNMVNSVVKNNSLEDLFEQVDRVVVFTSLGGFEALIRGIPVSTYGSPFYSGWGLTDDKFHSESLQNRRTRKLTLEELVFISLVEYPYYFSMKYKCLTELENILDELDYYKNQKKNLEQIFFRYWGFFKDLFNGNSINER